MILQGGVYWVDFGDARGSAPAGRRPCVVVQNDPYNRSPLRTVVVCALTTNLRRARDPGNVAIKRGEANISADSVVNVTQIYSVDKSSLEEHIGTLPRARLRQVVEGVESIMKPVVLD